MRCPRRDELGNDDLFFPRADEWSSDNTCSYCGSISPEEFMKAVRDGVELGPTDKSYKVYVGKDSGSFKKFYFQHLPVADRKEFVELMNTKSINIGYPGYFYVNPFFVERG